MLGNLSGPCALLCGIITFHASLLDAQPDSATGKPSPTTSTIEVLAQEMDQMTKAPYSASGKTISTSAGTFGDASRYLQSLPGVTAQSDSSTAIIVRGGNPAENLFLVNGFEVPNLNHLATESSTGGFATMIDSYLIDSIKLRTSGFPASVADRLSSVVEVDTLQPGPSQTHAEADAGLIGAGGLWQRNLSPRTSLLVAAHHGIVNLFTKNIGMNGVPDYTNALFTLDHTAGSKRDKLSVLMLDGKDSINIDPCGMAGGETINIQTEYTGWRATSGVAWTHIHSAEAVSILRVEDHEQSQNIQQQQQNVVIPGATATIGPISRNCYGQGAPASVLDPMTTPVTTVYGESTRDGLRNLSYQLHLAPSSWLALTTGAEGRLNSRDYDVNQAAGTLSPYSTSSARADVVSVNRNFTSGEADGFVESVWKLGEHWNILAGTRYQHFAIDGANAVSPRASIAYRLGGSSINASLASYAQQPPTLIMLTWGQNQSLAPMRSLHATIGADILHISRGRIRIETYDKRYRNLPVATEYPQVSYENLVDALDQQFTWLPMVSRGHGHAYGVEIAGEIKPAERLELHGSAALARAHFAGLDGIYRPGNYDFPIVINLSGSWQFNRSMLLTFRAEGTSGRPYTPFDFADSQAQNRAIYDLTKVNGLRGPIYDRVDLQVARHMSLRRHDITVYAGAINAFNHSNFLGYYWMPNILGLSGIISPLQSLYITRENQIGFLPNGGARFNF